MKRMVAGMTRLDWTARRVKNDRPKPNAERDRVRSTGNDLFILVSAEPRGSSPRDHRGEGGEAQPRGSSAKRGKGRGTEIFVDSSFDKLTTNCIGVTSDRTVCRYLVTGQRPTHAYI